MTVDQARPSALPRVPLLVFGGLALLGLLVFLAALGTDAGLGSDYVAAVPPAPYSR